MISQKKNESSHTKFCKTHKCKYILQELLTVRSFGIFETSIFWFFCIFAKKKYSYNICLSGKNEIAFKKVNITRQK